MQLPNPREKSSTFRRISSSRLPEEITESVFVEAGVLEMEPTPVPEVAVSESIEEPAEIATHIAEPEAEVSTQDVAYESTPESRHSDFELESDFEPMLPPATAASVRDARSLLFRVRRRTRKKSTGWPILSFRSSLAFWMCRKSWSLFRRRRCLRVYTFLRFSNRRYPRPIISSCRSRQSASHAACAPGWWTSPWWRRLVLCLEQWPTSCCRACNLPSR